MTDAIEVMRRTYREYRIEMTKADRVGLELMGEEGFFQCWLDDMEKYARTRLAKCGKKDTGIDRTRERQCRQTLDWIAEWREMTAKLSWEAKRETLMAEDREWSS